MGILGERCSTGRAGPGPLWAGYRKKNGGARLETLEELKAELDIDEEESDEDDDTDMEVIEEQLRSTWRVFLRAATTCVDRQLPLHVISD